MQTKALVIVDMIEAYLAPGGKLYCEAALEIVDTINRVAGAVRDNGGHVFFANTTLSSPTDPIARRWGMHAIKGSKEADVWRGMDRQPHDTIVPKTSYNSFFKTSLNLALRKRSVDSIAVVGIHTHVCVLLTAAAGADYGYDVIALEDAMTTSYRPNHETRLRFFSTHIGTLTNSSEYIRQL